MVPIGSILVDFDGTACAHDVAEHLLIEFGDPSWPEYDAAVDRGEIGLREASRAQVAMMRGSREELVAFALEHCPLDPTFAPFVAWCRALGISLTVVSDGFGLYIRPMLEAAGLGDLAIVTNRWVQQDGRPPALRYVSGHPECVGCGTCKMNAVMAERGRGPVAFVGEGQSDRYGALYADVVFAKDALVDIARADGVAFLPWDDFGDVRAALETIEAIPGPVGGRRCPGWRTA